MVARQNGVALLTAVLIVAIVSASAVAMIELIGRAQVQTATQDRLAQGRAYLRGLELWALEVLRSEDPTPDSDTKNDLWARALPPIELPDAEITGRLIDLNGRFNLNNLVFGENPELWRERFIVLLDLLQLPRELEPKIVDWIDADDETENDGAETSLYRQAEPAYRAANQQMQHASEIRLIAGVTTEIHDRLAPHIVALPATSAATRINVNFASPELLSALFDLRLADAEDLAEGEYENPGSFRNRLAGLRGETVIARPGEDLLWSVASDYLLAIGEIQTDTLFLSIASVLERNSGSILLRSQSGYGLR